MKLNKSLLIAAVTLFAASGLFAKEQTKKVEVPGVVPQPAEFFYTGKPYDADLTAYTFNYRNYDPEMHRWTSADPSGFPDGANSWILSKNAVSFLLDPNGLATQWVTGSYTWEVLWSEKHTWSWGFGGFGISFPEGITVNINPGFSWTKDGITVGQQESGTQPTEADATQMVGPGWSWVPETITITSTVQNGVNYIGGGNYLSGTDIWVGSDTRLGYYDITYNWKREAQE